MTPSTDPTTRLMNTALHHTLLNLPRLARTDRQTRLDLEQELERLRKNEAAFAGLVGRMNGERKEREGEVERLKLRVEELGRTLEQVRMEGLEERERMREEADERIARERAEREQERTKVNSDGPRGQRDDIPNSDSQLEKAERSEKQTRARQSSADGPGPQTPASKDIAERVARSGKGSGNPGRLGQDEDETGLGPEVGHAPLGPGPGPGSNPDSNSNPDLAARLAQLETNYTTLQRTHTDLLTQHTASNAHHERLVADLTLRYEKARSKAWKWRRLAGELDPALGRAEG